MDWRRNDDARQTSGYNLDLDVVGMHQRQLREERAQYRLAAAARLAVPSQRRWAVRLVRMLAGRSVAAVRLVTR